MILVSDGTAKRGALLLKKYRLTVYVRYFLGHLTVSSQFVSIIIVDITVNEKMSH